MNRYDAKIKTLIITLLLISSFSAMASKQDESKNKTSLCTLPIPWGKMNVELDKEIVEIQRYDMETIRMNVSYEPYFIQYFPIWVEIHLVNTPSWLSATPNMTAFYLQPREIKTVNIYLIINENVENGTQGIVKFEIDGRNILFPSLLQIDAGYVSMIAIKTG